MTMDIRSDARTLLHDLVSIESVSGNEAACAERLASFFDSHDRSVWIDEVGNVRVPGDDSVLLTSHIDTVPGDIPIRIEDGILWGRGSVDAKGSLASMAVAAVDTGVSYVGVVGEERGSRGARFLVEDRDPPSGVINGEPSGWDAITLGYRGHLPGTYVTTSESGHSSRPENNAIEDAITWWNRVTSEFEGDEWTPVFEQVTAKPVQFTGGPSEDGLSVEASMDVELRIPPSFSVDEVREIADGELDGGTVRWEESIPPVMESPRSSLARLFRVAIRDESGEPRLLRKTGTSDMNIFADRWSIPMVTYGPGDSSLDHTPEERLSLDEYDRSIQVLEQVCSGIVE